MPRLPGIPAVLPQRRHDRVHDLCAAVRHLRIVEPEHRVAPPREHDVPVVVAELSRIAYVTELAVGLDHDASGYHEVDVTDARERHLHLERDAELLEQQPDDRLDTGFTSRVDPRPQRAHVGRLAVEHRGELPVVQVLRVEGAVEQCNAEIPRLASHGVPNRIDAAHLMLRGLVGGDRLQPKAQSGQKAEFSPTAQH